ncbi:MAG: FecR domain-containing protein [Polyangiaceae bacterium]
MIDEASETRQLLAPLRDRPVSVDSERAAARRARVISSIEREVSSLGTLKAKRARKRAAIGAFALAAAALASFGALRLAQRHATPAPVLLTFVGSVGQTVAQGSEAPHSLRAGEALAVDPGEIQTAPSGSAELVSSAGLGLRLGGATRVALGGLLGPDAKQQVALQQGLLTCSVPHLSEGQRFSVQTPDARVVVHGTVFSVHVDATRAAGTQTCVEVTDGVVIVQHSGAETALNAGDSWGCEGSAPSSAAPSEASHDSDVAPVPNGAISKLNPRVTEHGTLSDERRLFQRALTADRLGQHDQAETLLNQLLTKYPSSPLAADARRALSRIASHPVQP